MAQNFNQVVWYVIALYVLMIYDNTVSRKTLGIYIKAVCAVDNQIICSIVL